ncbi:arylsulfatase [uncultured Croceitalea sp.]|uniref:arylsulfatase n=1 Tax=uncultured Croceitalea sp. TaxID=1798908 RepID=UPI0033063536
MIKERLIIKIRTIFILGILLFVFQSCKTDLHSKNKPNIILIVTDDQGWGDLGVNGNSKIKTPNIDRLASEGAQFNRFYVSPVCSPTRAEILTGRYHARGGVYSTSQGGERLDIDERTIAESFKSENYNTAAYGKWHNGSQPPYHPNNRGFDEFYGFCSGHWGNYFSPMLERNGAVVKGDGFIIDDLTNNAIEYIEAKNDDPFFVYLAFNTPHSPMQVPDKWWDKYSNVSPNPHRYDTNEKRDKTRAAYALCENIDWNVGRLVDKLVRLKLLENTIIVYMSDNGPNGWRWNDGLKGNKGHTDEGGVRSPFIMYWKDKIKPQKIDQIAGAIDILPTLTDLSEIPISGNKPLDGISLKPLLFNQEHLWNDRYIFSHWNGNVSLRNQQYMLDKDNQLYDLIEDPGQHNPIKQPSDSLRSELINAKSTWTNTVLTELDRNRKEFFPVGYEGNTITQLPARDGIPHGMIKRSNRWPNASYFTNWTSESDSISWNCNILTKGKYKATAYYTCTESAVGSVLSLNQGKNEVKATILEPHDPPFDGVAFDRFPRQESFEKDFKALEMGLLSLDEGLHSIALKASVINGPQFIDFRLLVLEHIN